MLIKFAKKVYIYVRSCIKKAYRRHVKESRAWYRFHYLLGRLHPLLLSQVSKDKDEKREIKSILIVYSRAHFNPDDDDQTRRLAHTSAANLARNMYYALSEDHNVTYVDQGEPLRKDISPDLIIGILSKSFIAYCKHHPDTKKVLFLVNSHPLFRLKELLRESKELGRRIPFSEYASPHTYIKATKHADTILLIGNESVKQTHVDYGIPAERIHLLNSGVNENLVPDYSKRPANKIRFSYVASDMGIRKGMFRLIQFWELLNKTVDPNSVELVMSGGSASFGQEIEEFVIRYDNVDFQGWVDSTTQEYIYNYQSSHIGLFPSIEEGQLGVGLESMACGCVPIITEQCGIAIEHKKDGYLLKGADPEMILKYTRELIDNPEKLQQMSKNIRKYIIENHRWEQFQRSIKTYLFK